MTDVRLLTADEAAAILRCSRRTVIRQLEAGTLPGQKVGGTRWVLPAAEIEAIAAIARAERIAELEALIAEAS
jgi:excisionase family DNA binding protein